MARLEPRQRTAIDGKVWWVAYDLRKQRYSTLVMLGKYRTKKACDAAIRFYARCMGE